MEPSPSKPKRNYRPRRNRPRPPTVPDAQSSTTPSEVTVSAVSPTPTAPIVPRVQRPRRRVDDNIVERLIRDLNRGYDCMVCMTQVRFSQPVWSCKTCYAVMHLKCVHLWIKRNAASSPGCEWRCPGCQYVYIEDRAPSYNCFCGRHENPAPSRQYTPHSCGELCSRVGLCDHPCTLPCHPGPCPPCSSRVAVARCYCGTSEMTGQTVKCGDPKSKPHSCGGLCNKPLACGKHACGQVCHTGPCDVCTESVGSVSCFCGSVSKSLVCPGDDSAQFSCGKICDRYYACKVHKCTQKCHPGDCGQCPLSPEIYGAGRCACGKTVLHHSPIRSSCTDPLPTCFEVCGKFRAGCAHSCKSYCHSGPCPPCKESVTQSCRCGQSKRAMPCNAVAGYVCDKVCRTSKSCSRHKCAVVCCPDYGHKQSDSHLCWQPCGKLLSCGTHTCDEICHLGKCKPCRVVIRDRPITCGCGKQSIPPPVACGTPIPACYAVCGKSLDGCEHTCPSMCHDGPCSLCVALVDKPCAGAHTVLYSVRCHAKNISCGAKCGQPLPCGVHTCTLNCHAGACTTDGTCPQTCTQIRTECGHTCGAPCHVGRPCPDSAPCKARVTISCICGLRSEETTCNSNSDKPQTLPCSLECERHQRQTALRQAFRSEPGIDDLDSIESERYSGELVSQVEKYDPKFIRLIDSMLADAAETRANTVHLPSVDSNRRWIVLEYAQLHYRFDAEVVRDGDHEKAVVVHFVPGLTRTPKPTLSQIGDMIPSQSLKYIVDFDEDGPTIHFYDVAKGYGKLTTEKIRNTLRESIGSYRTRRGEGFDMYLDFVDANKAVAAFRKLQNTIGLEQCQLLNVPLFTKSDESDEEHPQDGSGDLDSSQ
jgi:transcriptional repressor NF-X1